MLCKKNDRGYQNNSDFTNIYEKNLALKEVTKIMEKWSSYEREYHLFE